MCILMLTLKTGFVCAAVSGAVSCAEAGMVMAFLVHNKTQVHESNKLILYF